MAIASREARCFCQGRSVYSGKSAEAQAWGLSKVCLMGMEALSGLIRALALIIWVVFFCPRQFFDP